MTKQDFQQLSRPEKDEIVMNHGIFIINYTQEDFVCDVYKLYTFFVKFCYGLSNDEDPEVEAFDGANNFTLFEKNQPNILGHN